MKNQLQNIKHSLSMTLGIGIMLFVMLVFIVSLGFLFVRSRQLVMQEAMERAERALSNTALRVSRSLDEVQTIADNTVWMLDDFVSADSMLNYVERIVRLNPVVNGCSITVEPDFFGPGTGNFSAYSVRNQDTIETVIEGDYNYYEKPWYKIAKDAGEPRWIDPYNDFNPGTLSSIPMIASYSKPLHNLKGDFCGIISIDLAVTQFVDIVSAQRPYEHSYSIMLSTDGSYMVHPDRMKVVKQSIFTSFNEHDAPDIHQLGKDMVEGKTGCINAELNGEDCFIFYRPIPETGWSLALIVPESDIYQNYDKLAYIVGPLLIIGFILLFFICWKVVSHFVRPINLLAQSAHHIAEGHFDEHMPQSDRIDVVGQLQKNFILMQDAIDKHIGKIHRMNKTTEERNRELDEANWLLVEADQRKTTFLKDVSLQLRTPLNIIAGFMQVLQNEWGNLTEEEVKSHLEAMKERSVLMRRISHMILDASWMDNRPPIDLTREVCVFDVVHKVAQDFELPSPHDVELKLSFQLPETKCIHSNQSYLHRTLYELVYNAKKFGTGKSVSMSVETDGKMISFTVEDKGKGFSEEDRKHMFEPFNKADSYSDGLGLGLSLSRQTARLMGGVLELDPTYTEGARFIFTIPDR